MVIVTVVEGFQEDYGKSIGRIPEKSFQKLKFEIGEIVEIISGDRKVGVFLRPIEEIEEEIISRKTIHSETRRTSKKKDDDLLLYCNGFLRASIRVGLGQKVRIDKTSAPDVIGGEVWDSFLFDCLDKVTPVDTHID